MNTKTIKFDLNKYKLYEKIKAKQGDTKSRFLLFQLLDGSIPFNLKNRSVRAYMIKPDGREIFNDLIVNNYNLGYCTLELTNQVLAAQGIVKIELMVTEGDKKLTSSVFELEVVKSINSEKSIVSTNEFTALLNGLAALSEYDNYKNSVKEMEINKANKAEVEEKFISVEEKIKNNSEQLEHKTNELEVKKATKVELAVERERISNIIKNTGTSVNDEELQDGRVGANSVIYPTIGDSIREQIAQLNENLYTAVIAKLKLKSGYVDSTGNFITTDDGLLVSTDLYNFDYDTTINRTGTSEVQYKISYYDNDENFINSSDYKIFNNIIIKRNTKAILTFKYTDGGSLLNSNIGQIIYNVPKKFTQPITPKNMTTTSNLLEGVSFHPNKNVIDGADLVDFSVQGILTDSSVAFTYEPIQIRNSSGLIYNDIYLTRLNNSGVRQILFYDINGYHLQTIYGTTSGEAKEYKVNIHQYAWYMVVIGYSNVQQLGEFKVTIPKVKVEWLSSDGLEKKDVTASSIYIEKAYPNSSESEVLDYYKFPLTPSWGHEYLYSWYEKLYNNKNVVINVDGDSTSEEGMAFWNGGRRVDMIKKIMVTIGKYPANKLTINKNGYGSRTTGTYVGAFFNPSLSDDGINFPNGTLDESMKMNPDLIVFGYGINDASNTLFPNMTITEKLEQSKNWLEEALKRIRGNVSVNGRPAYNKSADELAVIICTPIQAENGNGRGREIWQQYQRFIFMELARKYHCAFYDVSARHYDHKFSNKWSQNNTTNDISPDNLHATPVCNADIFSGLQDLLFPICLWKWE